ncbi:MAG: TonB C-terminal domain-containing protein [Acidobacteria bacterium]|nr:TonB C-terminal domain-containing protein [Acidobacteriota bacterium]
MSNQPEFRLLIDYETEVARWRRRTSFLLAVFFQFFIALFLIFSPRLFPETARMLLLEAKPKPQQQATLLYFPRDLLRPAKKPPITNNLSDQNRIAQGKSPVINDHGLRMPYMRGNSRLPEIAGGHHAPTPPPAPPAPKPAPKTMAQAAKPPAPPPPAPKKEEQQEAQLRLLNVKPPTVSGDSPVHIPVSTPGQEIQQSLQAAAQNPNGGASIGSGDSAYQLQNLNPNFSTSGPIILSDTRGVNFGPYLARVVYIVRRNWYSMIPESARLGEKGRVALVFEILKDGSVPQLRLLASSGSPPLDTAALASIRASNPFPPLPTQFTGKHLVLEFIYFYNMEPGNY